MTRLGTLLWLLRIEAPDREAEGFEAGWHTPDPDTLERFQCVLHDFR